MNNELLRHILATIKYRFERSVSGSTGTFGDFSLGKDSRSAKEIIHHMNEVIYSTRFFVEHESLPQERLEEVSFEEESERFITELKKIDRLLDQHQLHVNYAKRLFQGPFSDVLTHIGQLGMLQRLAGNPLEGEDFSSSPIQTGIHDQ